jgi:hypothetical protein
MTETEEKTIILDNTTLALKGIRSYLFQILFVALAVLLPTLAHLTGSPVRVLLPMHWVVILAGLTYGWRGGAISGIFAPVVSFMISGFPMPGILMQMTIELFVYGFLTGLLREKFRWNSFTSVAFALIAGRIVFIGLVIAAGSVNAGYISYFTKALIPGLPAVAIQILLLPFIAKWWIKQEQKIS